MAGVSLSTVSRVVNGGDGVRDDLIARVRSASDLLGYRRDLTASTLRRADRLSASIGLIFEDVANPFFSSLQRGIEDVARQRAVLAFSGSSDEDPRRERELAEAFSARGVDGLIIVPAPGDHSYLLRERDAGTALVFVDRPARFIDADSVVSDNAGGARAAVGRLAAAGHRRIAFLGDRPEVFTAAERLRGYREALAHHGIPEDPLLVRHPQRRARDAYEAARELLLAPDAPSAVFTGQNLITIDAVRALHDLGLHRRVAHIGFDDVSLADVVDPPVTVVAQDPHTLGRMAAELLFSRLDGYAGPSRHHVVPVTLVERGSDGVRPT